MKWKIAAAACGLTLALSSVLSGCGASGDSAAPAEAAGQTERDAGASASEAESQDAAREATVRVTAVEGDSITAEEGTYEAAQGGAPTQPPEMPGGDGGVPGATDAPEDAAPDDGADGSPEGQNGAGSEAAPERPDGDAPEDAAPSVTDAPEGASDDGAGSESAPERPDGDASESAAPDASDAPEDAAPDGDEQAPPEGQMAPPAPSGTFKATGEVVTFRITGDTDIKVSSGGGDAEGTADDIVIGSVLKVSIDSEGTARSVIVQNPASMAQGAPEGQAAQGAPGAPGGFGGSGEVTNGTAANTIDEDAEIEGESYSSYGDDENALRIDGAMVALSGITVEKGAGDSSNTEDGDFYGQNAGLLALNGAKAAITGAEITTSATNGNAVFSYGEGTEVDIEDSVIRTTGNNSGGIQTTGGGTTRAIDIDVETQGNSSAAIRSDRGGGTVEVTGGTFVTNGTGSPAIYCTADISASDCVLDANASEGVVVEGKNSVRLSNAVVTGCMHNTYSGAPGESGATGTESAGASKQGAGQGTPAADSDENIHCVMIYQSMSGDAEVGEASFTAEGGSITSESGDMFYITNTDCSITLSGVEFVMANGVFLRAEGNSSSRGWGKEGENGGSVRLSTENQEMEGNILIDDISSLSFTMGGGTDFAGAINPDGSGGEVEVVMEAGASWTLTADSYITSLDGGTDGIDANGYHLYVDGSEEI